MWLDPAHSRWFVLIPDGEYSVAVAAPTGPVVERFVVDAERNTYEVVVPGQAPTRAPRK